MVMDYQDQAVYFLNQYTKLLQISEEQQMNNLNKGITFALNYLATNEGVVHPKELSEGMCVTTARIASLLNQMEQKNLIKRTTDPEDSRQIIVQLTENGIRENCVIQEKVVNIIRKMLEALGPEDTAEFIRIQDRILGYFLKTM